MARQLRRLNTNSRFHYGAVADFAERLAALLPDAAGHGLPGQLGLGGGGPGAAAGAGHDRAAGRGGGARGLPRLDLRLGRGLDVDRRQPERADHAARLGAHGGRAERVPGRAPRRDAASRYAADAVAFVEALAAAGQPPAAFLAEPFYGNAGGMALPDGYLAAVYAEVRRHGGLAIADEVQVGYGRLGHWFWGFEQQGVVPDIVTVAKAMGNGHPLGAVITTRAVADAYRDAGVLLLLDRRQPGVLRGRADRARRDRDGGAAGQRRSWSAHT